MLLVSVRGKLSLQSAIFAVTSLTHTHMSFSTTHTVTELLEVAGVRWTVLATQAWLHDYGT
jgi:hypothetical protein